MSSSLIYLGLMLSVLHFARGRNYSYYLSRNFIDSINQNQRDWIAGPNFIKHINKTYLDAFFRTNDTSMKEAPRVFREKWNSRILSNDSDNLPKSFDARKKWNFCKDIMSSVRDQGLCGSCWAASVAYAVSVRLCIQTRGRMQYKLSIEDGLTCCPPAECGYQCEGGNAFFLWKYYSKSGVVTGGDAGTHEGCKPYSYDAFNRNIALLCENKCSNKHYNLSYEKDKFFTKEPYRVQSAREMQAEILENGPIVAYMKTYIDFLAYKSGIYKHMKIFQNPQGHYVVLIGWGEQSGTLFWHGINSWGTNWGQKGVFKIRRGLDECEIETSLIVAGEVDVKKIGNEEKRRKSYSHRGSHHPIASDHPSDAACRYILVYLWACTLMVALNNLNGV